MPPKNFYHKQHPKPFKRPEPPERSRKISTKSLAELLGYDPASIRRALCVKGHFLGLTPVKLPNGQLRWDEDLAIELLEGQYGQ